MVVSLRRSPGSRGVVMGWWRLFRDIRMRLAFNLETNRRLILSGATQGLDLHAR